MQLSTAKAGNGITDSTLSFGVGKGRRFEVPNPYGSARSENVSACACAGTGRRNLIVCIGIGPRHLVALRQARFQLRGQRVLSLVPIP
jgi:hypothetical protein